MKNQCGECTLCCTVLGWTDNASHLDKYNEAAKYDIIYPYFTPCNKVCSTGCSIHENKPRICQEFNCDYITKDLGEEHKPINCGFVTYTTEDEELWVCIDTNENLKEYYKARKELMDEHFRLTNPLGYPIKMYSKEDMLTL
tara:strand:- start:842 stop:1264 length:423 start_codon:yes stop_codon:yes gene_type:complete